MKDKICNNSITIFYIIWHDITKQEVIDYSHSLTDKVAKNTVQETVEEIADEIAEMFLQ